MSARAVTLALLALVALVAAPRAWAYVAPGATVISASLDRRELADDATSTAVISGDGRFVAITTAARNLFPDDVADPPGRFYAGGLFRRDVARRRLELVTLSEACAPSQRPGFSRCRRRPIRSIARDQRYIVLHRLSRFVPADTNDDIDVYVRDMAVPRGPAPTRWSPRSTAPARQPPTTAGRLGPCRRRRDDRHGDGRATAARRLSGPRARERSCPAVPGAPPPFQLLHKPSPPAPHS